MNRELEAIADLEFGRAAERISREAEEKLRAATSGMPRGGQRDAALLQIELDKSEDMCRALCEIWVDLLERKNGQVTRDDANFIAGRVQDIAAARKGVLTNSPGRPRLASAAPEIVMRIDSITASIRRDLDLRIRKQEALPKQTLSATRELGTIEGGRLDSTSANRTIFVIHGRDERLRSAIFDFLRSLDLKPLEWTEAVKLTGKAAPYIGEILDSAFSHAQAVVVLFTPDDEARLRDALRGDHEPAYETQLTPQARPNVLFEAGMALARHPDRTVLVQIGELRPFSDIAGRHAIRMDNSTARRQDLAQRLQSAGCPINLSGTDWQKAGDLTPPAIALSPSTADVRQHGESGIKCIGGRVLELEQVDYGVWIERRGGVPGIVVQFTNEARPGGFNTWVMVKASLVYSTRESEALRIGAACWLDQQTDVCPFRVEETHALLLGLMASQQPLTLSKRRKLGDMGEEIVVGEHALPGEGVVRVRLIDADSGTLLYEGSFDFSLDPLRIAQSKTGASN